MPKHKKNPDIGEKKTVFTSRILIEQEDAVSFEDNEEVRGLDVCFGRQAHVLAQITLMDWGNAFVRSKQIDASGVITSIEVDLHLEGDFKKTKKKITWLAESTDTNPLVPVTLLDYDYLITKKKLEENDDVAQFTTPVTEFREAAVADANVRDLKPKDIMQFERKGYFVFDGEGSDGRLEFIKIPDGKAANLASKAGLGGAVQPAASKGTTALPEVPASSSAMYKVDNIYGDKVSAAGATSMYQVNSIY